MMIDFGGKDLLIGIGILCILLPVLWWQKRSLSYLIFFSIFWVYVLTVVQVVIFPIAIGTQSFSSGFFPRINLFPFYFGDCSMVNLCMRGIVQNIALTIPFGFGINFLIRIKPKNISWVALAVGCVFEFSQFVISLVFRSGFRATDINDVILNGIGILIGYASFRMFAWLYVKMIDHFHFRHRLIFADVYEVALQAQFADGSKNA